MTRYAIYFAPAAGGIAEAAARWLGRDAATDSPVDPVTPDLWPLTRSARRYGFHATLKAPFRLADGVSQSDLIAALQAFGAHTAPVAIAGLDLAVLQGFLGLVAQGDTSALHALAARVVQTFDPLRAPLTAADRARRNPDALSTAQRALLDRWGYPFVMEAFEFHLTLTDRLDPAQLGWVRPLAQRTFAPWLGRPLTLDALTLFIETDDGAFRHLHRAPLTGVDQGAR